VLHVIVHRNGDGRASETVFKLPHQTQVRRHGPDHLAAHQRLDAVEVFHERLEDHPSSKAEDYLIRVDALLRRQQSAQLLRDVLGVPARVEALVLHALHRLLRRPIRILVRREVHGAIADPGGHIVA
jgi:hypothetical protein